MGLQIKNKLYERSGKAINNIEKVAHIYKYLNEILKSALQYNENE